MPEAAEAPGNPPLSQRIPSGWGLWSRKICGGGEYGALVPEFHAANGYFIDGIISHGFLRKYASWTIDFDGMRFIIEH